LKVLIACEYSGRTRDAFLAVGCNAVSCDLLPTEKPGPHYQGDVRDILSDGWDMLIAHPDCTYLTCSAEWAYKEGPYHQKTKPGTLTGAARCEARDQALDFVRLLLAAPIKHRAIENPRGVIGTRIRPATQYIQPHEYGHDASKVTGLWLENLPPLVPTCHIPPRRVNGRPRWANQTDSGQNKLTPGPDRWKERARTYSGWSDAMAEQWGLMLLRRFGI
jgi:hypothetical protein